MSIKSIAAHNHRTISFVCSLCLSNWLLLIDPWLFRCEMIGAKRSSSSSSHGTCWSLTGRSPSCDCCIHIFLSLLLVFGCCCIRWRAGGLSVSELSLSTVWRWAVIQHGRQGEEEASRQGRPGYISLKTTLGRSFAGCCSLAAVHLYTQQLFLISSF